MVMAGFVVALEESEPGIVSFPNVPDAAGLLGLMRTQTAGAAKGPVKYMQASRGSVLGFTADRARAQVFSTEAAAQAAIDRIPNMVRPAGLSVKPA
jgi:hypothetical protein